MYLLRVPRNVKYVTGNTVYTWYVTQSEHDLIEGYLTVEVIEKHGPIENIVIFFNN